MSRNLLDLTGLLPVFTAIAGCGFAQPALGNPANAHPTPAVDLALMRAPSTDVLSVVAWGMAVVMGALVLAFVARLLNGRTRVTAAPAPTKEA